MCDYYLGSIAIPAYTYALRNVPACILSVLCGTPQTHGIMHRLVGNFVGGIGAGVAYERGGRRVVGAMYVRVCFVCVFSLFFFRFVSLRFCCPAALCTDGCVRVPLFLSFVSWLLIRCAPQLCA